MGVLKKFIYSKAMLTYFFIKMVLEHYCRKAEREREKVERERPIHSHVERVGKGKRERRARE